MLLKLMKYDLKSIFKKMVFYYIVVIGLAIFSKILLLIFENTRFAAIASLPTTLFFISLSLCNIVTMIISMIRYYKNMLSDEGYLTHTLPVKRSTILFAKLLSALIAEIASLLVMSISVFIFSPELILLLLDEILIAIQSLITSYNGTVYYILFLVILEIIIYSVCKVTEVAMCLTLGASHNKNKLVMAFVYYIGINFVLQIIMGIIISVVSIVIFSLPTLTINIFYIVMYMAIFLTLLYLIGTYLINYLTLKKKLNLQ